MPSSGYGRQCDSAKTIDLGRLGLDLGRPSRSGGSVFWSPDFLTAFRPKVLIDAKVNATLIDDDELHLSLMFGDLIAA
jgi:hypothetical protein